MQLNPGDQIPFADLPSALQEDWVLTHRDPAMASERDATAQRILRDAARIERTEAASALSKRNARAEADADIRRAGIRQAAGGRRSVADVVDEQVDGGEDVRFSRSPAADQTQTENFKRWFGDSKVVDADGKPLVVYHGTTSDFSEFEPSTVGRRELGIWLAGDPHYAEWIADNGSSRPGSNGAVVMPIYLQMSNPKRIDILEEGMRISEQTGEEPPENSREAQNLIAGAHWDDAVADMREEAERDGHDGLIFEGFDDYFPGGEVTVYVAFRPEQIKSATGNNGDFDPDNPDIRRSTAPGEAASFITAPDGSLDFGEVSAEVGRAMRRQAGKIRLQQGQKNADGTGWGLAHIEANHGDQIRGAGFASVEQFVAHVAGNFNEILSAAKGRQLLVAVRNGRKDVMFVQLERGTDDGDFYRVNTAFPASRNYLEKQEGHGAKVLWSGSEPRNAVTGQQPPFAGNPENRAGQDAPIARGQSEASLPATGLSVQQAQDAITSAVGAHRAQKTEVLTAQEAGQRSGLEPLSTAQMDGAEGFFDPATGRTIIIAENIRPVLDADGNVLMTAEQRAAWVAWHELFHRALAAKTGVAGLPGGVEYANLMRGAQTNPVVKALAAAIAKQRGGLNVNVATEEALAELRAAQETGSYDQLVRQYGIKAVPLALQKNLAGVVARFVQRLRGVIAKVTGRSVAGMSDAQVFDAIRGVAGFDAAPLAGGAASLRARVAQEFDAIVARMRAAGVLEVVCG